MTNFNRLPIVLRPGRAKQILLLAVCLAFAAMGVLMARDGERMGYLCGGFFGVGACIAVANMLPGAAYLKIQEDGFTFSSLFRAHTVPWSAVEEFGVFRIKTKRMVGWNYVASYPRTSSLRSLNRGLTGFEAALPDTYGVQAERLAEQMAAVRIRSSPAGKFEQVLLNGQVQL